MFKLEFLTNIMKQQVATPRTTRYCDYIALCALDFLG